MKNAMKKILLATVLASCALLSSCGGSVGVGLNVGVPIGNHGYMSLGTNRWF